MHSLLKRLYHRMRRRHRGRRRRRRRSVTAPSNHRSERFHDSLHLRRRKKPVRGQGASAVHKYRTGVRVQPKPLNRVQPELLIQRDDTVAGEADLSAHSAAAASATRTEFTAIEKALRSRDLWDRALAAALISRCKLLPVRRDVMENHTAQRGRASPSVRACMSDAREVYSCSGEPGNSWRSACCTTSVERATRSSTTSTRASCRSR